MSEITINQNKSEQTKHSNDIRCGSCHKKLGEGVYQVLTIKCPRCRTFNQLRAMSSTFECPAHLEPHSKQKEQHDTRIKKNI